MTVRTTLGCEFRRVGQEIVPLIDGPHGPHSWTDRGITVWCYGSGIMERPEYDTWFRVELYERGRWVPAPSPVDADKSADFDTEDEALAYASAMWPGLRRPDYRAPVRGQWHVRRVRGTLA